MLYNGDIVLGYIDKENKPLVIGERYAIENLTGCYFRLLSDPKTGKARFYAETVSQNEPYYFLIETLEHDYYYPWRLIGVKRVNRKG